jgi:hypothetical protein
LLFRASPGKIVYKTLSQKYSTQKKGLVEWLKWLSKAQGPEFKPQYHWKKKKKERNLLRFEIWMILSVGT